MRKIISVVVVRLILLVLLPAINWECNGAIPMLTARLSFSLPQETADAAGYVLRNEAQQSSAVEQYEQDVDRLIGLRSRPLEELLAVVNQMEIKWRQRLDWNHYAQIMIYVCSEIANHGLSDVRVRTETKHFASVALSHSRMFKWEYQSSLVGWLSDQRWSSKDSDWLRDRRENAVLWLQTWQRLEREFDPTFDIKDPKNRPLMRVFPPEETHLPAGSPPSAIKDPKLRAQYEAAIERNKRKSQRVEQQFPLLAHGSAFKTRAEHVLISLYSQPPFRNAELRRYLEIYVDDAPARQRILDQVQKVSN